jgi:hypothetical protein
MLSSRLIQQACLKSVPKKSGWCTSSARIMHGSTRPHKTPFPRATTTKRLFSEEQAPPPKMAHASTPPPSQATKQDLIGAFKLAFGVQLATTAGINALDIVTVLIGNIELYDVVAVLVSPILSLGALLYSGQRFR